ncbi:MAG: TIGR00266 family protein [Thermoflexales bacterium]|nr:TIGR00266 family protein [Thermoflexales bacterium]
MRYEIHGSVMQAVDVHLSKGESIFTESGGMAWMSGDVEMSTGTKGGLMAGLGRALAGESLFMTTYTCQSAEGMVVFTPEVPGKVLDIKLAEGQSLICQKSAFMCAESSVKLEMHFRKKLGAGLFGGEGFILQKLTGPGTVFVEIPGEVRDYTLQAGQTMKVDPGYIALFEPSVHYDIAMVKGLKNIFFAGEGLFLATLTGPGKIWLQTLPLSNLAARLAQYMPTKGG